MKVYVFTDKNSISNDCFRRENISAVLEKVAETTDTTDLVVAVYLLSNSSIWQGHLVTEWLGPEDFHHSRKRSWAFISAFSTPEDLPKHFKLIRMVFGTAARYPRTSEDRHGWRLRFRSFDHQVAYLFDHELHHFRRYHLGIHSGEGELSVCKWAVQRAEEAGFYVEAVRVHSRKRAKVEGNIWIPSGRKPRLLQRVKLAAVHLCSVDLKELEIWAFERRAMLEIKGRDKQLQQHFQKLRSLPDGATVKISGESDYSSSYVSQMVTKIKTLRRNSRRLLIRTTDGKVWRWPMQWLEVVE